MKTFYCLLLILCSLPALGAQPVILEVDPDQCVALEQGQTCFVQVTLKWQVQSAADICLYANEEKIKCWQNAKQGELSESLSMTANVRLALKSEDNVLISRTVDYAWVYRMTNRRAARWRLF